MKEKERKEVGKKRKMAKGETNKEMYSYNVILRC